MNIKYISAIILALVLGGALLFIPSKSHDKDRDPSSLLLKLNNDSRFFSTDEVASRLIEGDPGLLLVDIRDIYQYEEFHLPGALNIPLEELLLPTSVDYLSDGTKDIVFYSNGDVMAEKAWILAMRLNYQNIHIMKGGLNKWVENILRPSPPTEQSSSEAMDLYRQRLGASIFFGGSSHDTEVQSAADKIVIKRKKKKNVVEGGC